MRSLILSLFSLVLLLGTGCQNEEVAPDFISTDPRVLAQKWKWDSYSGTWAKPNTPVTGQTNVLQFNTDGTAIHYLDGVEDGRSAYTRAKAVSSLYQEQRDMIKSTLHLPFVIVKLSADELIVQEDVADGLRRVYHPMK